MRIRKFLTGIIVASAAFFGCSKEHVAQHTVPPPSVINNVDVYIGGTSATAAVQAGVATYWKNGIRFVALDSSTYSVANSIAVSGQDVYLAGVAKYNLEQDATYWKNGAAVQLTNVPSFANAISVDNGSIYIAGWTTTPDNNTILAYWKNGTIATINQTKDDLDFGMAVQGTDVYLAGEVGPTLACYWKNGIVDTLGNGTTLSATNAIALSGSDIYVAGTTGPFNNAVPVYWKNGTLHQLAAGSNSTQVTGIAVNGNDVYVCGAVAVDPTAQSLTFQATYWKNNVATTLSYGSYSTMAKAIAINGTDVYVAGIANIGSGIVPIIWKNGNATKLASYGVANSLVLIPQ